MFNIEDYNYHLPERLIAQVPASQRDRSRLLLVDRFRDTVSDHRFYHLPDLLSPGDLLVVNDTRVIPAKLFGRKESGGHVEILVLEQPHWTTSESDIRWCLLKSSKKPRKGSLLFFDHHMTGVVEAIGNGGLVKIFFRGPLTLDRFLQEAGCMPLPPYIKRTPKDHRSAMDRERYQTVFPHHPGAVAAPTAGLHFTEELMRKLRAGEIEITAISLHVGHGTFQPVRTSDIRDHKLGEEYYNIGPEAAEAINRAKDERRRVMGVGTTVVRTLETLALSKGEIKPGNGKTDLLITPGFAFKIIDGLITNFHLPKSSLLFLVSAFAGLTLIRKAYRWAIEKKYRFFSYGDAMLIV